MRHLNRTLTPRFFKRMGAGALVLMALIAPSFAQTTSGELTGTVFDSTGAVVPNAMVTATGESTNLASTTTTTFAGQYRINNLLVGKYDITVVAVGFTKSELKGVDVTLN